MALISGCGCAIRSARGEESGIANGKDKVGVKTEMELRLGVGLWLGAEVGVGVVVGMGVGAGAGVGLVMPVELEWEWLGCEQRQWLVFVAAVTRGRTAGGVVLGAVVNE